MEQNAHNKAVISLILGIIGVVAWLGGYSSVISLVLGIIGLILSIQAKKAGNTEGIRTAGFIVCLVCTIVGAVILISCIACTACGVTVGGMMACEVIDQIIKAVQ